MVTTALIIFDFCVNKKISTLSLYRWRYFSSSSSEGVSSSWRRARLDIDTTGLIHSTESNVDQFPARRPRPSFVMF